MQTKPSLMIIALVFQFHVYRIPTLVGCETFAECWFTVLVTTRKHERRGNGRDKVDINLHIAPSSGRSLAGKLGKYEADVSRVDTLDI